MPELGRVGDRIARTVRAGYKARSARGCSGELIRMALPSLESGEILDKERISGSTSTLNFLRLVRLYLLQLRAYHCNPPSLESPDRILLGVDSMRSRPAKLLCVWGRNFA